MGSSKKRRERGQPDVVLPNLTEDPDSRSPAEEGKGGATPEGIEEVAALLITLTQLNPDILTQTAEGDAVTVRDEGEDSVEVHTRNGRLGNVPLTVIAQVRSHGLTRGLVAYRSERPPTARVRLSS